MGTPANSLDITQAGLVQFDGVSNFSGVTVTQHDVLVGAASNGITSVSPSTSGTVLTSNGVSADPSFQALPNPTALTITGNNGGAISPSAGNWNLITANATPVFGGSGSSEKLDFGLSNLVLGSSLPSLSGGSANVGLGQSVFNALTSGNSNTAIGTNAGSAIISPNGNTLVGYNAGTAITRSANNTAIGISSLVSLTTDGSNVGSNTALGSVCCANLITGIYNCCIGRVCGSAYSGSESSNILIMNGGQTGESNVMRLGTTGTGNGQVNSCFIAGISGVTVTGTAVLCSSTGQLGTVASSQRYKENIVDISKEVSILDLRPVAFNFKNDKTKSTQYGLIAEEVAEKFPYLCFLNAEGQPESVKYHEMATLLLMEIQKLHAKVIFLESKIA